MATPTLTSHTIPGGLGEILVDVRAGSRQLSQPAVIILHGFKGHKDFAFLPQLANRLARLGYVAVSMTASGAGVDADGEFSRLDRFLRNTYSIELDDVKLVLESLLSGQLGVARPSSVAIVGHSRGGGMAVLAAAESDAVSAVVTLSAIGQARRHSDQEIAAWKAAGTITIPHARLRIRLPLDFDVAADCLRNEAGRLNIAAAASELKQPWLQLHGAADETVAIEEAESLAKHGGKGHKFIRIDGAGHTYGAVHPWQGMTPHLETVFSAAADFLAESLS